MALRGSNKMVDVETSWVLKLSNKCYDIIALIMAKRNQRELGKGERTMWPLGNLDLDLVRSYFWGK